MATHRRSLPGVLLWAVTSCGAVAHAGNAGDDPRAWLTRTNQALTTRNYQGVFVHEHAGQTETLRVIHRVSGEAVSERLLSMDGSGREFIRKGTDLICYLPDQRIVLVEKSPDAGLLLGGLPQIDASSAAEYEVREIARTRVSGRAARVIAVTPMDELRYGYRLWIDEATAMPLKSQLRDARGEIIDQIVFTSLTLPAHIADAMLEPAVDARGYRWVRRDRELVGMRNAAVSWQATTLPPGFRMTVSATQMLPGAPGPVAHLVFSDGLASVSVFVEARPREWAASPADDVASLGSSSVYSTVMEGYRITAIGEVPPATARTIARSIRAAERGAAGDPWGAAGSQVDNSATISAAALSGASASATPINGAAVSAAAVGATPFNAAAFTGATVSGGGGDGFGRGADPGRPGHPDGLTTANPAGSSFSSDSLVGPSGFPATQFGASGHTSPAPGPGGPWQGGGRPH